MTLDPGTRVLAAVDDSPAAAPVLAAATAMAGLLGAAVVALHVRQPGETTAATAADHAGVDLRVVDGDPITQVTRAAADPGVSLVVVGARRHPDSARPAGPVTRATLQEVDKPVLVVPADVEPPGPGRPIRRALFPLEGTSESSGAVAATMRRFADAGLELVALHAFHLPTAPAFWDQSAHAEQSWANQFVTNWCAGCDIDLHLRRGSPAETIVDIADEQAADLIALSWSQDMSPGRAAVVRATLATARTPVLLIPAR